MAGNARKVGAVRFERVTTHESESTKDVKKLVPKIMKRKYDDERGRIGVEEEGEKHETKEGE